jgi:hypothetical protein
VKVASGGVRPVSVHFHATFPENLFNVWGDPAPFVRFWDRLDAIPAELVAFNHAAILHALQNGFGPVVVVVKTPLAAGAPANFLGVDPFFTKGLQIIKNFTLVGIHTS